MRGEYMSTDTRMARPTQYARKLAVKNKIELADLVIGTGFNNETNAAILGAMLAAKNELRTNLGYRKYLQSLGESELIKFSTQNH